MELFIWEEQISKIFIIFFISVFRPAVTEILRIYFYSVIFDIWSSNYYNGFFKIYNIYNFSIYKCLQTREKPSNVSNLINFITYFIHFFWIRYTCRFNAGSRNIENNLRGCVLFLVTARGFNPVGHYPNLYND